MSQRIHAIAPTLPVADVATAVEDYVSQFGFIRVFDNAPVFAMVERDGIRIGLQRRNEGNLGPSSIYIWVEDVRAMYEELKATGVKVKKKPKQQTEYDLTDFVVFDRDNNHIGFGGKESIICGSGMARNLNSWKKRSHTR